MISVNDLSPQPGENLNARFWALHPNAEPQNNRRLFHLIDQPGDWEDAASWPAPRTWDNLYGEFLRIPVLDDAEADR